MEYIMEWHSYQCKAIFGAIMNYLVFWPYTFKISKKISSSSLWIKQRRSSLEAMVYEDFFVNEGEIY